MKLIKSIIAMAAVMAAMVGYAGDSAPFRLDTVTPSTSPAVSSLSISWDASWVGGDTNATVVIADNGTELKSTTGVGTFMYTLTSTGRNEFTYTTYIGGVAQAEVYRVSFYAPSNVVTFAANGGNVGEQTRPVLNGAIVGNLPMPTRTGYTFAGWWTEESGGTRISAATVPDGNVTYYAHWSTYQQLWEDGPYWATTNIGADNPEDYGYYFWWGDTVGYKRENNKWVATDGSSSNFSFGSSNTPTFNKRISTLKSEGWITADGVLAPEHDAAHVHWGGDWRMPTDAEFSTLINNCTTTWTTRNGVYGRLVTGKGAYADRSIFLPAVGYGDGSDLDYSGSNGDYWSSRPPSAYSYSAWDLRFDSSSFDRYSYYGRRYYGQSVRPVRGYVVTFNANGGTGETTRTILPGATVGALPTPTRTGYTFAGWWTEESGGTRISAATVPDGNVTYYAHWSTNQQLWEGGPYWATTNIGAENPEDAGYYFWWGDTVGYRRENDKWVATDGSSSNFSFSSSNTPTYNKSISTLKRQGWITADGVLVPEHDAAHVHWGGDWRMPTSDEIQALINNCTTTWTTRNGVYGRLVTGKGAYADRSIFLPAVGSGYGSSHGYSGSHGYYWSSTPTSVYFNGAWYLNFTSSDFYRSSYYYCDYGQSVRPVQGYVVAFNANGGSGGKTRTILPGTNVGALPTPTYEGYTFTGWWTAASDGTQISASTTVTGNVTYYAHWTVNQYTVTFNANGGTGGTTKTQNYGTAIVAPVVTRGWFNFAGWSPAVAATVPASNVTYVAQWRRWGDSISASEMGGKTMSELYPDDYMHMTTMVLEEGITELPEGFFDGCGDVEFVTWPSTLLEFGIDDLPPKIRAAVEGKYDEDGFLIYNNWILDYENRSAAMVTIPEGIVGIGRGAFAEMFDLETVEMPESLRCIAKEAFKDSSWIQEFQFMSGLRYVGPMAFSGCSSLLWATFADGVGYIGTNAFENCWQMQSVRLPSSVTNIGANAFSGCGNIRGVTVPTQIKTMQQLFPASYAQIETAEVADGETAVMDDMFAGCVALRGGATHTDMSMIPNTVTNIGARAFQGCTSLTVFVVPDSVTEIGESVLQGCSSLWNVTLSRNLVAIPDYAFKDCSMLETMIVPESVTYVGNSFFSGRTSSDPSVTIENALYYLCTNAPDYHSGAYAAITENMTTYVVQGSRSWDGLQGSRPLPELWNGYPITYWTPNRFYVTFDANGGRFELADGSAYTWNEQQITDTGYALPSTEPIRPGWAFEGWWTEQTGGAEVRYTTRVTATRPHTLYAHWRLLGNGMTVTFNANGGSVTETERTVNGGSAVGELPAPSRTGHSFLGWFTDAEGGVQVSATTIVSDSVTYYAQWALNQYTATFNANGGSGGTSVTQDYGTTLIAPTVTLTGYTLAGWSPSVPLKMPDTNVTYIAQWSVNQYTMTFDANGGEGGTDITQDYGTAIVAPTVTQTGYTLVGWSPSLPATVQASNATYTAQWQINQHTVTFDANGGEGGASITQNYDAVIVAPTVTREGYTFLGWATNATGEVVYAADQPLANLTAEPDGAVTLYAVWQEVDLSAPVISPADGTTFYDDTCEVTITCATAGTTIYYSTNGRTPRFTEAYRYAGSFTITDTTTVIAVAVLGDREEYAEATITKGEKPPLTLEGVLDASNLSSVTTSGDAEWIPVEDESAKVGGSCAHSGVVGMEEASHLEVTVSGKGTLTFWWKVSCEPDPRGRHTYDNLSYSVDGTNVAWIDGERDWAQQSVTFDTDGAHTVRWTYSTDDWEEPGYSDCGWVDGVVWTPEGGVVVDPLPEIASDSDVTNALAGAGDEARLMAHIGNKAQYDLFRAWVDAKGLDHKTAKDSPRAWFSYAIGANGLVEGNFQSGDVEVASVEVPASGVFTFKVRVKNAPIGSDATAANLATVFEVQGSPSLAENSFSSKNVNAVLGVSADGQLIVSATPISNFNAFFVRVRMYADEEMGDGDDVVIDPVGTTFSVTFDANGGEGGWSRQMDYGAAIVAPTVTRTGYAFAGWLPEVAATVPASNVTYTAQWVFQDTHDKVQLWEGGPYWATTNIGAENPEDYGYYFWWGDTVGYRRENGAWVASDGSSSNFSFDMANTPTYGKSHQSLRDEGWITADGKLAPEHDAAHVHWGGDWRMPTDAEFSALINNCTTTWTTRNGVYGRLVTGKGAYANRSIFLPAVGCGRGGPYLDFSGSCGYDWSSTPSSDYSSNAWYLGFGSSSFGRYDSSRRYYGLSVRPVQGYVVTFNANGGTGETTRTILPGATVGALPMPTREGYTFTGWWTAESGGTHISVTTVPDGKVTYYAHWTINYYTVTFDANGGTGGKTVTQNYGTVLSAPTVTRTGYAFAGWSPEVAATVPASNVMYTAQWQINQYTVTFDANGGTGGKSVTQNYDTALSAPTVTRTGYAFAGWLPEVAATVPASNVMYTAQWQINQYTVTFDANGGTGGKSVTQNYDTALSAPTVTRTGYAFAGWLPEVAATVPASNVTYKAQWMVQLWEGGPYWAETNIGAENPEDSGYYFWWGDTVGYRRENDAWVASDGSSLNFSFGTSNTPTYNKSVSTLKSQGWITADNVLVLEHDAAHVQWGGDWRIPTEQELVGLRDKCKWTWTTRNGVYGYVVKGKGAYASNSIFLPAAGYGSGTLLNDAESYANYWSSVPSSNTSNARYLGFRSSGPFTNGSGRDVGRSIRPVQGYVVTFNANGGAGGTTRTILPGANVGALPTLTREGYTFTGWWTAESGGTQISVTTVPDGKVTYYAHWTINYYTVTFDANGGTGGKSVTQNYGTALSAPTVTRTGYTFIGWSPEVAATVPASNVMYTAQWQINQYTVTFDANGGTGGKSVTQNYGTVLSAPTVTRTGYAFAGWLPEVAATVPASNVTYTAQWQINQYTVTFDANGGEGGTDITQNYGTALSAPTVTRTGYAFAGWSPEVAATVPASNVTYTAQWMVQLWEGGPYWAETNIGADNPEDYGYYFWWGDTVGYRRENDAWVATDGSSSNFSFSDIPTYDKDIPTLQSEGWITADGVLAPEHDAAHVHWGGAWRMPTQQELDDLNSNCDWTWTTVNGVNGYLVCGRGDYASNSIFLPAGGEGSLTSFEYARSGGYYWSSVPISWYYAWSLLFSSSYHGMSSSWRDDLYRGYGRSVRPVQGFAE